MALEHCLRNIGIQTEDTQLNIDGWHKAHLRHNSDSPRFNSGANLNRKKDEKMKR
jgi:hypothetical protein